MTDIFQLSTKHNQVDIPEIRIQAKNKSGKDTNDANGVNQLIGSKKGDEQVINILINTTEEFSDEAKKLAGKDVILIDGMQFAELLVKYGLDINE